jgi:hypothetical protein
MVFMAAGYDTDHAPRLGRARLVGVSGKKTDSHARGAALRGVLGVLIQKLEAHERTVGARGDLDGLKRTTALLKKARALDGQFEGWGAGTRTRQVRSDDILALHALTAEVRELVP